MATKRYRRTKLSAETHKLMEDNLVLLQMTHDVKLYKRFDRFADTGKRVFDLITGKELGNSIELNSIGGYTVRSNGWLESDIETGTFIYDADMNLLFKSSDYGFGFVTAYDVKDYILVSALINKGTKDLVSQLDNVVYVLDAKTKQTKHIHTKVKFIEDTGEYIRILYTNNDGKMEEKKYVSY